MFQCVQLVGLVPGSVCSQFDHDMFFYLMLFLVGHARARVLNSLVNSISSSAMLALWSRHHCVRLKIVSSVIVDAVVDSFTNTWTLDGHSIVR